MRCSVNAVYVLGVLLASSAAVAAPQAGQQLREVDLSGDAQVHAVQVIGWPSLTTAIKFNDSFQAHNVLCGQCTEVGDGQAETAKVQDEQRNWIIEKRVDERSIHVRPAVMPGRRQGGEYIPHSSFTTNIYVGLDGGHAVNIELKMLHPDILPEGAPLVADAVVTLKLPQGSTMTGKLAAERHELVAKQEKTVRTQAHQLMRQRLMGRVRCHDIAWRRPYRTDKATIQLNQLCSSAGPQRTFWVTFELENRGDAEFHIESATLEPESATAKLESDPESHTFDKTALDFGETAQGLALASLTAESEVPSSWRLVVTPGATDRADVKVEHLRF